MFCKNCGKELPNEAKFCNGCGAKAEQQQPIPNEVKQNVNNAESQPQQQPNIPPQQQPNIPPQPQPNTPPQAQHYIPPQTYQPPQYYTAPGNNAYSSQFDREPLSVLQYIGMFLLIGIPIVGIVLLFVWGFGSSVNLNKKNFARAMLILSLIGIIISIIFGAVLVGIITQIINSYNAGYFS